MYAADFAEADTYLAQWLREATGIPLLVRPGLHGAHAEEHVSLAVINISSPAFVESEYVRTPATVFGELDAIEHCTVNDYVLTYQVALHNCHDHIGAAMKALLWLKSGHWKTLADTRNLHYLRATDIRPSSYVEDEAMHYVTRFDVDVSFRCRLCVPTNAIETVPLRVCDELAWHDEQTVTRP